MPRDVAARGDPDVVTVALDVVEEPGDPSSVLGLPDQAHVEPDRHHLRRAVAALLEEEVDGVLHVLKEHRGGAKVAVSQVNVVVLDRIRDHQVRLLLPDRRPIWQIVVVRIRVVLEAGLGEESPRVDARCVPPVPAQVGSVSDPDRLLERLHREPDMLPLLLLREVVLPPPPPAVATDVDAGRVVANVGGGLGLALEIRGRCGVRARGG